MTSVTRVPARLGVLLLVGALAVVACGGDDDAGSDDGDVPAALSEFVDRIAEPGKTRFTAEYSVLQKYGGQTDTVVVTATPPSWEVRVDDVVATGGADPRTCWGTPQQCTDAMVENQLSPHGISSEFFAAASGRSLEERARQSEAQPTFSTRTEAGVDLDCATVADRTVCITDDGVVGLIDDASRRVVLTGLDSPG